MFSSQQNHEYLIFDRKREDPMVLKVVGSSEYNAHVWSKTGSLIPSRHFLIDSPVWKLNFPRDLIHACTCAKCFELPSWGQKCGFGTGSGKKKSKSGSELTVKRLKSLIIFQLLFIPLQWVLLLLGGPNITANLYCIICFKRTWNMRFCKLHEMLQ